MSDGGNAGKKAKIRTAGRTTGGLMVLWAFAQNKK